MKLVRVIILCFFVISCSSEEEIIDNSDQITPGVKIINFSNFSTSTINSWSNYGVSKMKDQNSDVLLVSWNIGDFISEGGFDRPYNKNQVVLTSSQIEDILSQISTWLDRSCLSTSDKSNELKTYRNYLENGADASSQIVLCSNSRIILTAFQEPPINFPEKNAEIQSFILHELYHAFQHDLGDINCTLNRENNSVSNGRQIVEGAAEYFGKIVTGQMNGSDGVNTLLGMVYFDLLSSGSNSIDDGNNWAAGIRLMIERNWLDEDMVLNGSLFHNCETENLYTDSNSNMAKVKSLFSKIEKNGDKFTFSSQALND